MDPNGSRRLTFPEGPPTIPRVRRPREGPYGLTTTPAPIPRPRPAVRAPRTAGAWGAFLAALCAAGAATGCGSPAPRPINPEFDLHDPSGTRRSQAVTRVEVTNDTRYVPALISRLDDEDETVRLLSSRTLKDLTGHDTGYRATMESEERRRHVDLWRAWWASRSRGTAGGAAVPIAGPVPGRAPAPAPAPPCATPQNPGRPVRGAP